ncbi:ATP-binding protein [Sandaracinus amylolyticus]|uniref:Putative ATP-binding protein n=1 Tax=Sandaracinus amylolyticus TaxID=927083 RepID=A0A0F6W359_9BACT|nr:ATP-binding protein [Sandaracinus amylolyticus]AKF06236.1 putative ATP-binding protein [Sandaracinus amylolyticus]
MTDGVPPGTFYLGRDGASQSALLYPSKHLLTHGVIVGMTGSGKTGLGAIVLEEAALCGIPAIAIDPKGDLGNLKLAFPALRPEDFAPFVPEGEDPASVAQRAREGLVASAQSPERIARFAGSVDRTIYTPGSRLGRALSLMPSLDAPPAGSDDEGTRDRAVATASALLSLAGVDADPVRSPEHVLVSNVLLDAWRAGRSLDPGALLRAIQSPPFDRLGVMDLDSVIAPRARQEIAVSLNAALASPSMAGFLEGEPLDVQSLLFTREGKPRLSVLSIAHLADAERMFFVTALLGEVLAWMRAQPGTQSLRALLYMDEIAGFFPPVASPPSKAPMLTLLKQARAFGLGVVLATQNPVDLDYKGLSNAGTWMLGRLQTERDKLRVLDGLEGVAASTGAGLDRARIDTMLSSLAPRTFLLHDIHAGGGPKLFTTRWALSYLRGPLSREHFRALASAAPAAPIASLPPAVAGRPVLSADVRESFVMRADLPAPRAYRPGVAVRASVHYADAKLGVDAWLEPHLIAPLGDEGPRWAEAWVLATPLPESRDPQPGVPFATLPASAARAKTWDAWTKQAATHVLRDRPLTVLFAPDLGTSSHPGEPRESFLARIRMDAQRARGEEDREIEQKWSAKIDKARDKLSTAERRLSDAKLARDAEVVDAGASVLGAMLGGGSVARSARSAARRTAQSAERRARAEEAVQSARLALEHLERDYLAAKLEIARRWDPGALRVEERRVAAKKSAIKIERCELVWVPSPS